MSSDAPNTEEVFWALTTLMTGFTVEITPRECRRIQPYHRVLPPRTNLLLTPPARWPPHRTVESIWQMNRSGMRPVVRLAARPGREADALARPVATLGRAGVRDLVLSVPSLEHPADTFRWINRMVRAIGRRGTIDGLGVSAPWLGQRWPVSAGLLDALEEVQATALAYRMRTYLVVPLALRTEEVLRWELALRAAGNRLPVHVRLPGLTSLGRLLGCGPGAAVRWGDRLALGMRLTAQPCAAHPAAGLVELASTVATDPDTRLAGVHLAPLGSTVTTARWADALCRGNFVLERRPQRGHVVEVLG